MRSAAIASFAVVLALFVALGGVPYLTEERELAAGAPTPPALTEIALVEVNGGSRMCVRKLVLDPQMGIIRFRVGTYGKPGPALSVDLASPGYEDAHRIPAGWKDNAEHSLRVKSPPEALLGHICIRNEGTRRIAFYGANDQARSRVIVDVDSRRRQPNPTIAFFEAKPATILHDPARTAKRIAIFRGPLGYSWVVWLTAIAFLIALPVALLLALSAFRPELGEVEVEVVDQPREDA